MGEWAPETVAKLAGTLPSYLWVFLASLAFWQLRKPIAANLGRATQVEAFGVKLALAGQSVQLAVQLANKHHDWNVTVPSKDRDAVLRRVEREHVLFQGAEILWVDDAPGNNRNEARMLTALGAHVAFAASTNEALAVLRIAAEPSDYPVDVVISDMKRGDDASAGMHLLAAIAEAAIETQVIFYIGTVDPLRSMPTGAVGLTERPDRLLHYVLDALARRPDRGPMPTRS